MIRKVLVLGSGSAGLLAALTLKRKIPSLDIEILRDPNLGVIGVGEGTTPNVPEHLFDYLGIKQERFYKMAQPTWKLGIRFEWGSREIFNYTFSHQLDRQYDDLKMPSGFYCDEDFNDVDPESALMSAGKAFARNANGSPVIPFKTAFHIENHRFVETLEKEVIESKVVITNGTMSGAQRGPGGITAVHLTDGRKIEADLYVDASGFGSELLGKVLEEPFENFNKTLFCDRAVVGGWQRGDDEPIMAYTTAEAMNYGWSWKIEHEEHVNRGYVYCSDMISDDAAFGEFRRKNPKVPDSPRIIRFRSGCHRRTWVDNVIAIGNSSGFVEPLEATALMIICSQCRGLAGLLIHSQLEPTPAVRQLYNENRYRNWEIIRDFLGLHYQLNQAGTTDFWRRCREETDLSGIAELLQFYRETGPSNVARHFLPPASNDFGIEGFLVMLVGNQAPYEKHYEPSSFEQRTWDKRKALFARNARKGVDVKEALQWIRRSDWKWQ